MQGVGTGMKTNNISLIINHHIALTEQDPLFPLCANVFMQPSAHPGRPRAPTAPSLGEPSNVMPSLVPAQRRPWETLHKGFQDPQDCRTPFLRVLMIT